MPQIELINKEYGGSFKPLKEGLIDRNEFGECIEAINDEQSFVISGNVGYGKSGCTEAILNYCEGEDIPYIAIIVINEPICLGTYEIPKSYVLSNIGLYYDENEFHIPEKLVIELCLV